MTARSARRAVPLVVASIWLLSWLAGEWFQGSPFGRRAELFSYDLRFGLRREVPSAALDEIVLLVIDDESFERIPDPLILWQGHIARVIDRLVESGAAAVGVDLILPDVSRLDPSGSRLLVGSLLGAEAEGVPVRLVYRIGRDSSEPASPILAMALGQDGFAFANLTTDEDDFVRRQELFARDPEGNRIAGFAASLARTREPDLGREPMPDPMLINFQPQPRFATIPFWTALQDDPGQARRLSDAVSGKIVLIGILDEGDLHPTPLYYWRDRDPSGFPYRRTPGLAIHAHALNTILSGDYLEPASPGTRRLLSAMLVLAVALTAWRFPPLAAALIGGGLMLAYGVFAMTWSFSRGTVFQLVGPVAGSALAFALSQSAQYVLVGREKRRIHSLFGRYVSPPVIEELLSRSDELALSGEKRSISVLFSDIRNFTTLSERSDPQELVAFLNRYLTRMVAVVQANGGMVDKFIGDAVMAIFGAPVPREDHARQAVQTALAMASALESLNRELAEEGLPPLSIGIGIHSGEAIVGNIGSPERLEYTAIGDVVNTASRLESLTKAHSAALLVSRETYSRVSDEFEGTSLGEVRLKGKATPVEVIRLF